MRVSDLIPLPLSPLGAPAAPAASAGAQATSAFDADGGQPLRIVADVRSSRGLGVAGHAAQVLAHLCGDGDAAASRAGMRGF